MNTSYIKLNAKKRLVNNHLKSFLVSVFPYVSIVSLTVLNYYLFIFLKQEDFSFNRYISSYAEYIRPSLFCLSVVLSFLLWRSFCFLNESFFFQKTFDKNRTLKKVLNSLSFRQFATYWVVSMIKFFLSVSWAALYLLPCAVVSSLFYYCYRFENGNERIILTLFVSACLLLVIGISFLYVTLKRYTLCGAIINLEKKISPVKAVEKSLTLMEGKTVRYSLYCFSFIGWAFLCLLIFPAFYVLPYKNMGKYEFTKHYCLYDFYKYEPAKPIIFYIPSRVKN